MTTNQTLTLPMLSLRWRRFGSGLMAMFLTLFLVACTNGATEQKQTVSCIIASNDGANGFRTDEISNCRVDVTNGEASFVLKQKKRSRSYEAKQPLTPQYRAVATYWLNRVNQIKVPAQTNPKGFDARAFLKAASRATGGFVLVRSKKNGGQAINIAFITDGVYRSIDFSSTNTNEIPSGFLTTGR